jgi:hypothetical protein
MIIGLPCRSRMVDSLHMALTLRVQGSAFTACLLPTRRIPHAGGKNSENRSQAILPVRPSRNGEAKSI